MMSETGGAVVVRTRELRRTYGSQAALVRAVDGGGTFTVPPARWLAAAVAGTLAAVAALVAVPARIGARLPVTEILQAETA